MAGQCPFRRLFSTPASSAAPAVPFTDELHAGTRAQHDAAEHHELHAILFGSQGVVPAMEAYTRLLGQHLTIQKAFEGELDRLSADNEYVRALQRPHHRHLLALHDDLDALRVNDDMREPLDATLAMAEFIRTSAAGDAAPFLGVYYVLEGSTNGGTIIARRVRALLSLEGEIGTRFINPHGQQVRTRWMDWKQVADSLTLSADQRAAACRAAGETFTRMQSMLTAILDELRTSADKAL